VSSYDFEIGTTTALKLIPAVINLKLASITGIIALVINNAESLKVVTWVHARRPSNYNILVKEDLLKLLVSN
jgi:hypothetical protein